MAKNKCQNCPDRHTAEHCNPDCHTDRCEKWKAYREQLEAEREQRMKATLSQGLLAEGYNRAKSRWLNSNQNRKQSTKLNNMGR